MILELTQELLIQDIGGKMRFLILFYILFLNGCFMIDRYPYVSILDDYSTFSKNDKITAVVYADGKNLATRADSIYEAKFGPERADRRKYTSYYELDIQDSIYEIRILTKVFADSIMIFRNDTLYKTVTLKLSYPKKALNIEEAYVYEDSLKDKQNVYVNHWLIDLRKKKK